MVFRDVHHLDAWQFNERKEEKNCIKGNVIKKIKVLNFMTCCYSHLHLQLLAQLEIKVLCPIMKGNHTALNSKESSESFRHFIRICCRSKVQYILDPLADHFFMNLILLLNKQ